MGRDRAHNDVTDFQNETNALVFSAVANTTVMHSFKKTTVRRDFSALVLLFGHGRNRRCSCWSVYTPIKFRTAATNAILHRNSSQIRICETAQLIICHDKNDSHREWSDGSTP